MTLIIINSLLLWSDSIRRINPVVIIISISMHTLYHYIFIAVIIFINYLITLRDAFEIIIWTIN